MPNYDVRSDDSVLADLGQRLERHRVARNLTQAQLAEEAGVSRATVQRLESGQSVQLTSLIRLLRRLDLLTALDTAIPPDISLPIEQLARERRAERKRVRHSASPLTPQEPEQWTWGDEQ